MRFSIFLTGLLLLPFFSSHATTIDKNVNIQQVARSNYLKSINNDNHAPSVESILGPKQNRLASKPVSNELSLQKFVRQVVSQNNKILIRKTDWEIKQTEEEKTQAIFEPEFVASIKLEDNSQRNSVEESLSRQFATTYRERNWDYAVSVNGYMPTGAKYNLGYNLSDLSNTVTQSLADEDHEYQMYLGFSITQPLLKNAGVDTTKAGIYAADAETTAAFHDSRLEMMQVVNKATLAYWNYFHAQEKLKLVQDSIRIADKVLADNKERHRTGKMAETEVYEAMIGVASRKSLLSQAKQEEISAENSLRTFLAVTASPDSLNILVPAPPTVRFAPSNKDSMLQRAFELQPSYLATQAKIKHADIKVAYAKNQRWPELDLTASYGLNGLDFKRAGSWEQVKDAEYDVWSIGMEFRLPIFGGIDSRSELKKVELEKKRLLIAFKDIEIKLTNDIDTSIHEVANAITQSDFAKDIVEIKKILLDTELTRLQAGKSNSRLVLDKEDSYRNALEVALRNKIKLQTALINLEFAEGTILQNYGVEIMEDTL